MKFTIKHEIRGRLRVRLGQARMTEAQADTLQYYLGLLPFVTSARVRERLCSVTVCYTGGRESVIAALKTFHYNTVEVPESYIENSGRKLNNEYWDKLVNKLVLRAGNRLFLPYPVRAGLAAFHSVRYIWKGLQTLRRGKIEVPVLDATAIAVSMFRGDIDTASSVMFLLGVGELLEEWTHKNPWATWLAACP